VSNRAWIGAGVIAMFIGCRTTGHPGPSRTEALSSLDEGAATGSPPPGDGGVAVAGEDEPSDAGSGTSEPPGDAGGTDGLENCADPPKCTGPNGTGIYAAEGGFAGITALVTVMTSAGIPTRVPRAIMITHFINNSSSPDDANAKVTFAYGYFDPLSRHWTSISNNGGQVEFADYQLQKHLDVTWVREADTASTWMLRDSATNATTIVTDTQLLGLALHISFPVPGAGLVHAVLDFSAAYTLVPAKHFKNAVRVYNMRWRYEPNSLPQQYCHGPNNQPDTAVFQQGIYVDPMTGTVSHQSTANFVTLSCSLGAPTIVYAWGYPYQSNFDTFYFDAGIHMKRASYCGDENYYTVTPTQIQIKDDKGIQDETPTNLEARWDRHGAICVNLNNLRHPELKFNGTCNNRPKPECKSLSRVEQRLIEGPRP
jgi:ADYC domain-containing protein